MLKFKSNKKVVLYKLPERHNIVEHILPHGHLNTELVHQLLRLAGRVPDTLVQCDHGRQLNTRKNKKCEQQVASWNRLPACHPTYEE